MDLTVLNFDNVYKKQPFLQKKNPQWIELQSIPNTNLFCEKHTLTEISKYLAHHEKGKISLIGSGNYHYITYLFLEKITRPFTLLLFDHHTDTLKSPTEDLISCGSWVLDSLEKLPNLKRVLILGVSEEAEHHIPSSEEGKVSLYTKHYLRLKGKQAITSILKDIPTEDVYISIDKDVLDTRDAVTAWDHGSMRLKQMLWMIKKVIRHKRICGVDICGEYPVEQNEFDRKTYEANEKNSTANQFIIGHLLRWLEQADGASDILHA